MYRNTTFSSLDPLVGSCTHINGVVHSTHVSHVTPTKEMMQDGDWSNYGIMVRDHNNGLITVLDKGTDSCQLPVIIKATVDLSNAPMDFGQVLCHALCLPDPGVISEEELLRGAGAWEYPDGSSGHGVLNLYYRSALMGGLAHQYLLLMQARHPHLIRNIHIL